MLLIDFRALRGILSVVAVLELHGAVVRPCGRQGWRAQCPVCRASPERPRTLHVARDDSRWYCHYCRHGGDALELHQRIGHMQLREAAVDICRQLGLETPLWTGGTTWRGPRGA